MEESGIAFGRDVHGFSVTNTDLVYPYIILVLCTNGRARALYDMQELILSNNELGLIMPGHIMHPLDNTSDFTFAWFVISPKMLNVFLSPEEIERFDKMPICKLTDEQAKRLLTIIEQVAYVAEFSEEQLPQRNAMLNSLLKVGYELLILYRKEQDREWVDRRHTTIYSRFCDLVVLHHTQSRNVNYYAKLLGYDARYFSKMFRTISNGMSPLEWIGQYVATQSKHIIDTQQDLSIKEIAYQLGFPSTANFCRYFKRITGMTPQEYKKTVYDISIPSIPTHSPVPESD